MNPRKIKILIAMYNLGSGGAERSLIDLLSNLDPEKYKITLFLIYHSGIYFEYIPSYVNVISGPSPVTSQKGGYKYKLNSFKQKIYRNIIRRFPKLVRLYFLKLRTFDLEISYLEGIPSYLIANWKEKSRRWCWIHTDPLLNPTMHDIKDCYKFERIICASNAIRNSYLNLAPTIEEKFDVIYNPINVQKILTSSKEPIDLVKENLTAIYVGRLSHEKQVEMLIHALKNINSKGQHSLNLWIVGEGDEEKNLRKLTKELELDDIIHFFGFQKNPYKYISKADFIICPSKFEGFSLAIAEAILLKKPVVSTDTIGPREILNNGELGIICENNIAHLEIAINKMCNKEVLAHYQKKLMEFNYPYSISKCTEKFELLVEKKY